MPYNVERILLMASNMDTKRVQNIMTEFENSQENGTKIPADILSAIQSVVVGKFSRKKLFFFKIVLKIEKECKFLKFSLGPDSSALNVLKLKKNTIH